MANQVKNLLDLTWSGVRLLILFSATIGCSASSEAQTSPLSRSDPTFRGEKQAATLTATRLWNERAQ
jgi:hypothetical protein